MRVFLQVVGQSLAYGLLNGACNLGIAQLGLGLSLELWFCDLDRDNCRKTFTEVLAAYLDLVLGEFFQFLGALLLGI